MIIPSRHIALLKQPLFSFWIGTASPDLVPEVIKCTGVILDDITEEFTCFIGAKFAEKSLRNLASNAAITLLSANISTYEGYQYKGRYAGSHSCTEEEVLFQERYMDAFTTALALFGYSKEGFHKLYFLQPSIAIKFKVEEVYEQSPRKGTGGKIGG
jgi:hypothetical protein